MKLSIDVSIYPPNAWHHEFTIETSIDKREYSVPADCLTVQKLMAQMHGIEYEILERSIAIHGWIPGPEQSRKR